LIPKDFPQKYFLKRSTEGIFDSEGFSARKYFLARFFSKSKKIECKIPLHIIMGCPTLPPTELVGLEARVLEGRINKIADWEVV